METTILILIYKPLASASARKMLVDRLRDVENPQNGRWTKRDVKILLAATWQRVDEMLPAAELEKIPTRGSRNNVFLAIVTTAAYRELLGKGISQEYAARLIGDIGWKMYARGINLFSFPFRMTSRDPSVRIEKTIRLLMKFPFSAPGRPAYEAKVWKQGQDYYTHWTWCPPQAYVQKLVEQDGNRGELEAFYHSWCLYDWPGADIMAGDGKQGHYERRLTQSRGDSVCDMCWKANP